jgi:hypothetical protein
MLRVTTDDGRLLATIQLPADGEFALRYRNSLYGTLAEEYFAATPDGLLRLIGLAAEQLAVLEEYYEIDGAASRTAAHSSMRWRATPAQSVLERQLRVAATDLGRRTLVVDGATPIDLWRLVDDARPVVVLEVASGHD